MEERFQRDFSHVRVHSGDAAACSARALGRRRDEDGYGMVLADPLPPELADLARLGAAGCPERAIAVSD